MPFLLEFQIDVIHGGVIVRSRQVVIDPDPLTGGIDPPLFEELNGISFHLPWSFLLIGVGYPPMISNLAYHVDAGFEGLATFLPAGGCHFCSA